MLLGRARTVTALLAALVATAGLSTTAAPAATSGHSIRPDGPQHSSDDRPGVLLAPRRVDDGPFGGAVPVRKNEVSRPIAPGLTLSQWRQVDPRGRVQAHLLHADLSEPSLRLRYARPAKVAAVKPTSRLVRRVGGVAGVNGDFFDIGRTGAPLGVGVDQGEVLHGPAQNWTTSFVLGRDGTPSIGAAPVMAKVKGRPDLEITNVNSPHVHPHGIGIYTPAWGRTPGRGVAEGAKKKALRQVVVRNSRVVANQRKLQPGKKIHGRLLIGRGDGATALRALKVGTRVKTRIRLAGRPALTISGSEQLLAAGEVLATDDRYLHPRTAIGIDHDTGALLVLVVDGRHTSSRGVTLVELAMMLREAGAEDALNFDGGGSTTMVAVDDFGQLALVNRPSDGTERKVPNGLAFTSTPAP